MSHLSVSAWFGHWFLAPPHTVIPIDVRPTSRIYCGDACEFVFASISVWPHVRQEGTLIEWRFGPFFDTPGLRRIYVQASHAPVADNEAWEIVGLPVEDGDFAIDETHRLTGKAPWTHYRLVLQTDNAFYISKPVGVYGTLPYKHGRIAEEIIRLERLRMRYQAGQEGFLLKRKLFGEPCSCRYALTDEVLDPDCRECFGTGIKGGYWTALNCIWAEISPQGLNSHRDTQMRGTVEDGRIMQVRMLNIPQLHPYDIWVDAASDIRYVVRSIREIAVVGNRPLVVMVELRQLPFSHIAYEIPIHASAAA
jgi:hypothetical protein